MHRRTGCRHDRKCKITKRVPEGQHFFEAAFGFGVAPERNQGPIARPQCLDEAELVVQCAKLSEGPPQQRLRLGEISGPQPDGPK